MGFSTVVDVELATRVYYILSPSIKGGVSCNRWSLSSNSTAKVATSTKVSTHVGFFFRMCQKEGLTEASITAKGPADASPSSFRRQVYRLENMTMISEDEVFTT